MFKIVLGDYKSQAWSALKSVYNSGNWFLYVYVGIMVPLWLTHNNYQAYIHYSAFAPMLLGLLLSRMYPNRISKTLLLCPMTLEDRKNYLLTGFQIRIGFSLLLFLLCNIPLLFIGKLMILSLCVMFISLFMFLVSVNIYCSPTVNAQSAFEREYDLPGYYPIWEVAAQLVGIFGMIVLANIQMTQQDFWEDKVAIVIVAILLFIQLGLCIKMICTYYKPVMEQAIYEWHG